MKVSLNWLSQYIDTTPLKTNLREVIEKLAMRGIEVERVEDLSKGFDKVIVAQIETRDKHPNADRLSVCKVNTGKEVLQIVCGAQNMKAGDKVALSMIGAHLPNNLKIEKGKIRDVESFGMLCSETELMLAKESEGILILPPSAKVGTPLAEFLGRDDKVLELNLTPNRGDVLSHLGFAREVAAVLGQKVNLPKTSFQESSTKASSKVKVQIEAPKECQQFHARYIEGVKIGPSPEWLQKSLQAVGLRPINNVVDITNYVMFETGQPLHAYDYSKLSGGEIRVRMASTGEKLKLLNGQTVDLRTNNLVIADSKKPVALAGVMGGEESEVDEKTTTILLEGAQFLSSSVRTTARFHQLHSDAGYRFERQIDPAGVVFSIERATALIAELAQGKPAQGRVSSLGSNVEVDANGKYKPRVISIELDLLNKFLGIALDSKTLISLLSSIGFSVKEGKASSYDVAIPSFRPDVTIAEDIYEEVLRVYGYDKVEAKVPLLKYIPAPQGPVHQRGKIIEKIKTALALDGYSEAVNFAFVSKKQIAEWGGPRKDQAVELANPLNEEMSTLRTSLTGSLFENLMSALNHQQQNTRLFEIRPVYFKDSSSETGVREEWRVSGVAFGRSYTNALSALDRSIEFYDVKGTVEKVLESSGARGVRYSEYSEAEAKVDDRFHPAQTAVVALGKGPCGYIARLHPKREAENKLRLPVYFFEISLDRILEIAKTERKFSLIPKFPKVFRDFSLVAPDKMTVDKVVQTIQKLGKPLVEQVSVVDLYRGEKVGSGKFSVSIALILGHPDRTLEEVEIDALSQKLLSGLENELGVTLRLQ